MRRCGDCRLWHTRDGESGVCERRLGDRMRSLEGVVGAMELAVAAGMCVTRAGSACTREEGRDVRTDR